MHANYCTITSSSCFPPQKKHTKKNPSKTPKTSRHPTRHTGVQSFKGRLRTCTVGPGSVDSSLSRSECLLVGGTWQNSKYSFDNIGSAILTLIELSSLEMWPEIMYSVVDAGSEQGDAPVRDNDRAVALYFVAFILIGSFFVLGLFAGVVVDEYEKQFTRFTGRLVAARGWVGVCG